jgi:uncharacterized repeat protein (TIGR01451 family)
MKNLISLFALLLCLTSIKAQNYVTISDTSFVSWLQHNIPNAMLGNQMDTSHIDVTSKKQIIIQNKHVASLDGVQYFDSLKTLICSINVYDTINIRLSYLPALPSMLDTLICDGNALDSLPQLPIGLMYFTCSQNLLDSLPTLPNTLKYFECWGNQLDSLPTLPDSLQHFNCCNNQLQLMPALPNGLTTFTCSNNQLQNLPTLSDSLTSLNCNGNQLQLLPALPNKLNYLDCSTNQLTTLPITPNSLTTLICNNNAMTSISALSTSLDFMDCSQNQLPSLPTLPNSLTILNCSNNNLTSLPVLSTSLFKLISSNNSSLVGLPSLPNSLSILYCSNDGLQGLPTLPNSLLDLNCSSNPIGSLPTLPNYLNILDCHSDLLPTLPTLPNSLTTLECNNNQLQALPTLPNSLYSLNCAGNLIAALPTIPNSLSRLICSSNSIVSLPSLPTSINYFICSNNQIASLPTLPNSLNYFDCSNNDIHCFAPFNNISYYFNISNNPFSCLPNYIPVMDLTTLNYPLCAAGNPFNCPSSFGIVGFAYTDNNTTCLKDSGDVGIKNVPMKIYDSSSNLLSSTYTALNGVYQFLDSANTYNVIVDTVGMPFQAACIYPGLDSTVTVAVLDTNINFALTCKPGFDVGIQSIYTCGIVFPGQTHVLSLNAGDISRRYDLNCAAGIGGTVRFVVTGPVSYMGPAAGALVPSVSGNVFTYIISDFATINNSLDFRIQLQPFPTAQAGDIICIDARVTPINGDNYPSNNQVYTCYNVVNSHDPNIKEVYPIDVEPGFHDWLTYTIHFQNTGNAPAFNIMLKDTLDSELDLTTFQVTDYSHINTTTLTGKILTVNFQNIQLPDSASNPEGSIGFIQYRLKPKSSWAAPYQIKNTAYIYFDFNDPIVTNTTLNSIMKTTGITEVIENIASIFPNPTNGLFTIELTTKEKQSLQLFDMAGNIVLTQIIENGKANIDANDLAAGIYNISIKGGNSVTNKKLVIVK